MPLIIIAMYNLLSGRYNVTYDNSIWVFLAFALFIDIILVVIYSAGFMHILKGLIMFVCVLALSVGVGFGGKAIAKSIAYTKVDTDDVDYI